MKYKIQRKSSSLVVFGDLDKSDIRAYALEAEKYLANSLKLKGFRPGKIPSDLVRRHLDKNEVMAQTKDMAVKQTLVEILIKEKLEVLDGPRIEILKANDKELSFKALLTVFPELTLGSYIGLKAKKEKITVEKQDIDSALEYIRNSMARLEKTGQGAKPGDRVEVDFRISENGKSIDQGESPNHPLILGETKLLPGVEHEILGTHEGQNKKFTINVSEDYQDKRVSGKKLDFDIHVQSIHRIIKPELDDEFAKKLGNFKNIEDLKKNLEQGIKTEKEEKEKDKIRIFLLNQVVDNSKMEVPEILIDRQLDKMISEFDQALHGQGMELALYLARIKKTQEDLRKEWKSQAEKTVKSALVVREIATKENLRVSEEEVKNKINEFLLTFASIRQAQDQINLEVLKKNIEQTLINEKVFRLLESKALIT